MSVYTPSCSHSYPAGNRDRIAQRETAFPACMRRLAAVLILKSVKIGNFPMQTQRTPGGHVPRSLMWSLLENCHLSHGGALRTLILAVVMATLYLTTRKLIAARWPRFPSARCKRQRERGVDCEAGEFVIGWQVRSRSKFGPVVTADYRMARQG